MLSRSPGKRESGDGHAQCCGGRLTREAGGARAAQRADFGKHSSHHHGGTCAPPRAPLPPGPCVSSSGTGTWALGTKLVNTVQRKPTCRWLQASEECESRRQGDRPNGKRRGAWPYWLGGNRTGSPKLAGETWKVQEATPRSAAFPRGRGGLTGFKGESDDMDLTTCRIMYFNINTVIRLLLKRSPLPTALHNFLR